MSEENKEPFNMRRAMLDLVNRYPHTHDRFMDWDYSSSANKLRRESIANAQHLHQMGGRLIVTKTNVPDPLKQVAGEKIIKEFLDGGIREEAERILQEKTMELEHEFFTGLTGQMGGVSGFMTTASDELEDKPSLNFQELINSLEQLSKMNTLLMPTPLKLHPSHAMVTLCYKPMPGWAWYVVDRAGLLRIPIYRRLKRWWVSRKSSRHYRPSKSVYIHEGNVVAHPSVIEKLKSGILEYPDNS